jgi:hypothetical protein
MLHSRSYHNDKREPALLETRDSRIVVAILLLSAVVVFASLPDHATSPVDVAHPQREGAVDLDHKVYLPAVMKALDTTSPTVVSVGGASLSYEVDGQTIQRAIVVQDLGGTYSFDATGDEGDIPYGITSTLTITGIQTSVDLTDILVEDQQEIEAQVTDACDPGENPCDISVSLNPTYQPKSPIDASVPYSFTISLVAYGGKTQLGGVEGEVFNPFELEDLGLPVDLDQIASLLETDSRLRYNYNDTHKLDYSCGTGTHLGDVSEIYTDFEEGGIDSFEAPMYDVYAPIDFMPAGIQGDARRRLVLYSFVGYNVVREPIYFSFIHVTQLEDNIKQGFADSLGIDPSDLTVDYGDSDRQIGPYYWRDPNFDWSMHYPDPISVEKGTLVGFKKAPWDWDPFSGLHHALGLHVNLTKNDPTDNIKPVEASMPELTPLYMNRVIQKLVLDRGLIIGIEYFGENFCASPEQIRELMLEHIRPEILEQIDLYQWPERPQHFDVSREPFMESASLSYDVDGQTIQRTVVIRDGGTYLDATGDDGDIPFGVTSTLSISGIRYDVIDVSIQNPQGIDAQVVDACDQGENPCDITIQLNPLAQPESSIDPSLPYSFGIYLDTAQHGGATIDVRGEIFRPFRIDELELPVNSVQIKQALQDNPNYSFVYGITNNPYEVCGNPAHLGDIIEFSSVKPAQEGETPIVNVYSPGMNIIDVQGDVNRGLVFTANLGRNEILQPIFYTIAFLTRFEDSLKQQLAAAIGVPPEALDIDYDDPNSIVGPYRDFSLRTEEGQLIGYKQLPFSEIIGDYRSLKLMVVVNKNSSTFVGPPENSVPEMSAHYLNKLIQELVIGSNVPIRADYRGEHWCDGPERLLGLIDPQLRNRINLSQDPQTFHLFDISKKPLIGNPSLTYQVDGQIIERTVVVTEIDEQTYSIDATEEISGDIPFGITSTLTLPGMLFEQVDSVSLQNVQGINAQLVDDCALGEIPCSASITLAPLTQPESPIDPSLPYSLAIYLQTAENGGTTVEVNGEVFRPFRMEEAASPLDWDQVIANFQELSGQLEQFTLDPVAYYDTHRADPYNPEYPGDHPHDGDAFTVIQTLRRVSEVPIPMIPFDLLSPYEGKVVKIYDTRGPDRQDGTVNVAIAEFVGKDLFAKRIYFETVHNNTVLVEEGQRVNAGQIIGQLDILYKSGQGNGTGSHISLHNHPKGWDVLWEDYPYYIDPKPTFLKIFMDEFVIERNQTALLNYGGPDQQKLLNELPPWCQQINYKTELHQRFFYELERAGYTVNEIDEYHGKIISSQGDIVPFAYYDCRTIYLNPPE